MTGKTRLSDSNDRYLAFQLGSEQYAIPLLTVKEVIEMTEPVPVPQTPTYFKGIINLRGQVISILDLRTKLKLSQTPIGPKTAIIILDLDPGLAVGVVVDRVNSVLSFEQENMSPPLDQTFGINAEFLTGIARRDDKLTLLLNIRSALDLEELKTSAQSSVA